MFVDKRAKVKSTVCELKDSPSQDLSKVKVAFHLIWSKLCQI